jgi:antitoxin component HigA of HigAB toxin-antitoxin module
LEDDKSKVGKPDRDRVSATEKYEVADFAEKWDLPVETVVELIDKYGNNRAALERAAKALGEG